MWEWSSGFAILLREVRNYYMFLKSLKFKIKKKKEFSLLGLCRSWEVLSAYCSRPQSPHKHGLPAVTGWTQHRGACPASRHLSKPQWHFIHRVPKPHAVPSGFSSLRGQDMLEWCLVSSSRKFVR